MLIGTLFALIIAVFVFGCATDDKREVKPEKIRVEEQGGSSLSFNDVQVYQEGDDLIVHGHLHKGNRNIPGTGSINSHVDMEIVLTNGNVIRKTDIPYQPGIISRRGSRQAHFSTLVSIDPAEISIIRLEYHVGEHQGN